MVIALSSSMLVIWVRLLSAEKPEAEYLVLLIDNSSSMDDADTELRRIRFTRFIVSYAQQFYPDTYMGAVTFAGKQELPRVSVALSPVATWSRADFDEIREYRAGQTGTAFGKALEKAQELFFSTCLDEHPCEPVDCEINNCHIILFTDGEFTDSGETSADVTSTIQNIEDNGIEVLVTLFDYEGGWDLNKTTWETIGASVLPFNPKTVSVQESYSQILQSVQLSEAIDRLSVLSINQQGNLSIEIPPYLKYAKVFLFSDSPISDTWTLQPDIASDYERWWLTPNPGIITGNIQVAGVITESLLYYLVDTKNVASLEFYAQVQPAVQEVGKPIILYAQFQTENGDIISNTSNLAVHIQSSPKVPDVCQFRIDGHGIFSCTLPDLEDGKYIITFTGTISNYFEIEKMYEITKTVLIGRVPVLDLTVASYQTDVLSQTVPFTVTVHNFYTIQGAYTPTIQVAESGQFLSLIPGGNGVFLGSTQLFSANPLTFKAQLPEGVTNEQLLFVAQTKEKQIEYVYHPYFWIQKMPITEILEKEIPVIPDGIWGVFGISSVLLVIMLIHFVFLRIKERNRYKLVFPENVDEEFVDQMVEKLRGYGFMWPEISAFGKELADIYGEHLGREE